MGTDTNAFDEQILSKTKQMSISYRDNGQNISVKLGERIEGDLDLISPEERSAALHRLLVEPGRLPIAYGAATNWQQLTAVTIPALAVLVQRDPLYPLSTHELLKEGIDIYYGANSFVLPLHLLESFLDNSISGPDLELPVAHFVKRINVTIDIRRQEAKDSGAPMAQQLLSLKRCIKAEDVKITLHGEGALNGTDFAAQSTMKLIAKAVGELCVQHGPRLSVVRACNGKTMDITSYWSTPNSSSRRNFGDGNPCSDDMMRIQVHSWKGGR